MGFIEDITALGRRALTADPVPLGTAVYLAPSWDAERPIYYIGNAAGLAAGGYLYAVAESDRKLRGVSGSVIVGDLDQSPRPAELVSTILTIASKPRGRVLCGLSAPDSLIGRQLCDGGLFHIEGGAAPLGSELGCLLLWYEVWRGATSAWVLARSTADAIRELSDRVRTRRATTLEVLIYGNGQTLRARLPELQKPCTLCGSAGPALYALKRHKQAPAACCSMCAERHPTAVFLYSGARP